jgi:16S rRNA (guanine(966)-N(2))-methyltransferase RsmD
MRVIAGEARGRHLKVPKGTGIRPATDLVRGAIFSILENMAGNWSRVLDVFSGTGAMGIEALSRGAGWVDLVEREPRHCAIIKENLAATGLGENAHVYCISVAKALELLDKEYGIIIMDPPYADRTIDDVIGKMGNSKLVGDNTVVVVTHSPRFPLQPVYPPLKMVKEHRHGDSVISVFQKEVSP